MRPEVTGIVTSSMLLLNFIPTIVLYNVKITLPQNYIVGTCGLLVEKDSVPVKKIKLLPSVPKIL